MGKRGLMGYVGGGLDGILSILQADGKMHYTDSDGNRWVGLTDEVSRQIVEYLLEYRELLRQQDAFDLLADRQTELEIQLVEGGRKIEGTIQLQNARRPGPSGAISFKDWQKGKGQDGV